MRRDRLGVRGGADAEARQVRSRRAAHGFRGRRRGPPRVACAEFVAANILGVTDVDDQVALLGAEPTAGDVEHSIKKAFKRRAKLDADDLSVESTNGTVTLSGVVTSWSEHDAAVDAAWGAPGVTRVDDRILVEY
jgi:osmotically-inducible protein OsmY